MISPSHQWAIQIDITNACNRACSNCTRMLAHARKPFFMTAEQFRQALVAVRDFPAKSPADKFGRQKVIGLIGGEPLLHPEFEAFCDLFRELVPNPRERGLWTGLDWRRHKHRAVIERTFLAGLSYINPNDHSGSVYHSPVLVAAKDVIEDEAEMWRIIHRCRLQEEWASAITPRGFFFCEVAAAFDTIFQGSGGKSIVPGCWEKDIATYRNQIERWCPRCGICLGLEQRRDRENLDDISRSNFVELQQLGSPRVLAGDVALHCKETIRPGDGHPLHYLRKES